MVDSDNVEIRHS